MATSITASTNSPYSMLNLQDINFNVSAGFGSSSLTASTPAIFYPNVGYPEVGRFAVQVYNTALVGTAGTAAAYVGLQESNDGITWNNIAAFSSSLLAITNTAGSASAGTSQVLLTPNAKPYLRAVSTTNAGGAIAAGITGSFGIQTLF
jgi:hypothetical protein